MTGFLFFSISAVVLISAIMVIVFRNPIHSALSLVLTFFSLAGLYILLNAQFVAAIQVIVYAGAIMVLFLFVIMLLNLDKVAEKMREKHPLQKAFGIAIASFLLLTLGSVVATGVIYGTKGVQTDAKVSAIGNTKAVASLLFTDWVLPFEITSILLLAAIVGAIVLSKKEL